MRRSTILTFAFALLALSMPHVPAQAKGVSGAIFTTDVNGSVVNGNQYASKCDVYLDGGPGPNAPAKAAGLPDGDYYFQVTDPSGEQLLSTDPVSNRKFRVAGGVIVAHTGSHMTGIDQDHWQAGAITIRLADTSCPADFLSTPNNGGVYKVWATPAADFVGDPTAVDNVCGNGCFHGFVPAQSKTDNFKVKAVDPTFCLTVLKQFPDEQGVFVPYAGWMMTVTDTSGTTNSSLPTDTENGAARFCGLTPATYIVMEEVRPDIGVVGLFVNGWPMPPDVVYSFTWQPGDAEPVILFQNEPDDDTPPPM
jgi:hypothetical protein